MPNVDIIVQRANITIPEGTVFPIYSGFMTPAEILTVAEVPNFGGWRYDDTGNVIANGDEHHTIASYLTNNPTDYWQRPLNHDRVESISGVFSTALHKRLMANPVLLGENTNATNTAEANIGQPQQTQGIDQYQINCEDNGKKPLLILDGQHRIFGLNHQASTRNNKIPVVILMKNANYTKSFLAQIFTEVTTGAESLLPIHEWWMKFTFSMDPFTAANYKRAMKATIQLCTMTQVDGTDNEFYNQVKFNPTKKAVAGPWNVTYDCIEWTKILFNYYENCALADADKMTDEELAITIVRFTRAAYEKDQHAGQANDDSKVFGSGKKTHDVLRDSLYGQLIKYCSANSNVAKAKSKDDWINDILDPGNWSSSDWRLDWIQVGTMSSSYGKPTKKCADHYLGNLFNNPAANNAPISSLLSTHSNTVRIVGNVATPGGQMSNAAGTRGIEQANAGSAVSINLPNPPDWPALAAGGRREFIRVKSLENDLGSTLWRVDWTTVGRNGSCRVTGGRQSGPIDLRGMVSPINLRIETVGYSGSSIKVLNVVVHF